MLIFRMSNCIITASGIVTLCKRLYSMPVESRLLCSLLSTGANVDLSLNRVWDCVRRIYFAQDGIKWHVLWTRQWIVWFHLAGWVCYILNKVCAPKNWFCEVDHSFQSILQGTQFPIHTAVTQFPIHTAGHTVSNPYYRAHSFPSILQGTQFPIHTAGHTVSNPYCSHTVSIPYCRAHSFQSILQGTQFPIHTTGHTVSNPYCSAQSFHIHSLNLEIKKFTNMCKWIS